MAFSVQRTASAAFGVIESKMLNAVGSLVPMYGAVKAIMDGVVMIVNAEHNSTLNPLNTFTVTDLPFKNEIELQATMELRQYVLRKSKPEAVKNQVVTQSKLDKVIAYVKANRKQLGIFSLFVLVVALLLVFRSKIIGNGNG